MKFNINFNEDNYKMVKDVEVGQCFIMLGKKDLFIMTDDGVFVSFTNGETFDMYDFEDYPVEIKENLVICEQSTF